MKTSVKSNAVKTTLGVVAAMALAFGSQRANANNLFGIDVSHYQGSPNWSSVHSCGAQYAFAKATEGNYYHDSSFNYNMSNGKAAGMQMGAYDFARPDLFSPATEANYFWAFAGGKIIADGHSLYPMVDFEVFNGHVGASSYTAWFNAWSADVKAKTSHFLRPVIYASAGNGMCDLSTSCVLSAWVAHYNGENLYTGNPWDGCCSCCNYVDPCTKNGWTYWQVSSTGSICGISGNTDFDAYPLSLSLLISYQGVK
jgi:GH25 family lysozyme M1 (1,4-beta-N-acetylmuramidase)